MHFYWALLRNGNGEAAKEMNENDLVFWVALTPVMFVMFYLIVIMLIGPGGSWRK
jgi:hypothetical protein